MYDINVIYMYMYTFIHSMQIFMWNNVVIVHVRKCIEMSVFIACVLSVFAPCTAAKLFVILYHQKFLKGYKIQ